MRSLYKDVFKGDKMLLVNRIQSVFDIFKLANTNEILAINNILDKLEQDDLIIIRDEFIMTSNQL
tara:strand:- start:89 stop:283 length:195 start_codon:yes stop_codon:yes gene_type:complete